VVVVGLAVALGLIVISGCRTDYSYVGSFRKADLSGAVFAMTGGGAGRSAVAGAQVALDDSDPVTTDASGRFLMPRVRPGVHRLRVTREGFLPVEREIEFLNRSQVVYVRLPDIDWAMGALVAAVVDGDTRTADELAVKLIGAEPHNPVARYALALRAMDRGDPGRARFHLGQIQGRFADNPYVVALKARVAGAALTPGRSP
jgi:hypothetical protein